MVPKPRWGGLRIEPFDPDARDADGDGIVQEGTAWERPAGLQLVDELGRAIARGQTSKDPMRGLRYVDRSGQDVTYEPTWGKFIRGGGGGEPDYTSKRGLARLGVLSLEDRGHRSILDIQLLANTQNAEPSKPVNTPKYIGIDGQKRFIAEHPKYTALVEEDRANEIFPNTYYREGKEDEAFTVIVKAQGFDGKPTPITADEADELVARGGIRIYRGLPDPEMITELREGEHYSGRGVDGAGYYFGRAPSLSKDYIDKPEFRGYEEDPNPAPIADRMVEMILPPDAKIINSLELRDELVAAAQGPITEDLGHIAAMRGYDAILVPEEDNPHPHSGDIFVVLNRGILSLPPQPSEKRWEEMFEDTLIGRPKLVESMATLSEIKSNPEFLAKSPQEQVDYLRSLIASRKDAGLFTEELSRYMRQIEDDIPNDDRRGPFV